MSKHPKCEGFLVSLVILLVIREKQIKIKYSGASLVAQWLRLHTSSAGGEDSIPGRRTKIPHATLCGQKFIFLN